MNDSGVFILVGAGGTGSILAPQLLRHLRSTYTDQFVLMIVDADQIEEKNIARQGYDPDSVGLPKSQVLAAQLGTDRVRAVDSYITPETAPKLIRDGDVVLIAADNYRARADIEQRALELDNLVVINGGNEETTATTQLFIRRNGRNLTPPLSYMHPEILTPGLTRQEESCLVRAADPNNRQTIAANMLSAAWMLAALVHYEQTIGLTNTLVQVADTHDDIAAIKQSGPFWHELHATIDKGKAGGPDWRDMGTSDWEEWRPEPTESPTLEAIA